MAAVTVSLFINTVAGNDDYYRPTSWGVFENIWLMLLSVLPKFCGTECIFAEQISKIVCDQYYLSY